MSGDTLTFSCTAIEPTPTNSPADLNTALCAFNPDTNNFDANSGTWAAESLTICAVGTDSKGDQPPNCVGSGTARVRELSDRHSPPLYALWLIVPAGMLFCLKFGFKRGVQARKLDRSASRFFAVALLVMASLFLLSCGGGAAFTSPQNPSSAGMPAGTYSLTIQATGKVYGQSATNYYVVPFTVTPSN